MAFKYYYQGNYSCLESECDTYNSDCIQEYLQAMLTHKIVYRSYKDTSDFIVCEMMHFYEGMDIWE